MTPLSTPTRGRENAVCCDVLAQGTFRVMAAQFPTLRQTPGLLRELFSANFLKHADEQSLVALGAVYDAMRGYGLERQAFDDWAVLAGPRFLGRSATIVALQRFASEGAWGISPHLIPHRSLHAVSGTLSQALKIRGPNFGVGGGQHAAAEALLAAAALVSRDEVPGAWLVLTGWDEEPVTPDPAKAQPDAACSAVALALVPARPAAERPRLWISPGPAISTDPKGTGALFSLEDFLEKLAGLEEGAAYRWDLTCGGSVEFERVAAAVEINL